MKKILVLMPAIIALFSLPLFLHASGEWWEPNGNTPPAFKIGPNSFEDPHHHPADVHERLDVSKKPWYKKIFEKNDHIVFKTTDPEDAGAAEEQVTTSDGKFGAFTSAGKMFIMDLANTVLYEIQGISLDDRPFSGLVWVKDRYLVFDRWSNPHYGIHYVIDVVEKKALVMDPFPDEFTLAQGRPEFAVRQKFLDSARYGDLDAINADINSPDLNEAVKSLALLTAINNDCDESTAAALIGAKVDVDLVIKDFAYSPRRQAVINGCEGILKLMADAAASTETATAQPTPQP